MSKVGFIFSFLAGAAVGAIGTYLALNGRYTANAEAEEDFQEKREQLRSERESEAAKKAKADQNKGDILSYAKKVKDLEYEAAMKDREDKRKPQVYVIPPEEFGEMDYYEKISLTYYQDGVLCEGLDPVDGIEEVVGDALEHFGEYEEDSVYVRNDQKKCDYEILLDLRNWTDLVRRKRKEEATKVED